MSAPTTAIYDALTRDVLPKDCVCWTLDPHLTGLLDDKTAFTHLCNKVTLHKMLWGIAGGNGGLVGVRFLLLHKAVSCPFQAMKPSEYDLVLNLSKPKNL